MERLEDEYLLEVYRQAGENARMYASSRFSNLSSFLTYVSILTAALALLYGNQDSIDIFETAVVIVSSLGCVISVLFLALEIRHHHWWQFYELEVVKSIEAKMGWGQYPSGAGAGKRRDFVGAPRSNPLARIGATRATYGVYATSVAFFLTAGLATFIL